MTIHVVSQMGCSLYWNQSNSGGREGGRPRSAQNPRRPGEVRLYCQGQEEALGVIAGLSGGVG